MTRVLIHGAGRMAQRVLARLQDSEGLELMGLVSRTRPHETPGSNWYASLDEVNVSADLLIDFTLPGGTRLAAQWCSAKGVALLSGTTGLPEDEIDALKNAALNVPVLWAPNLSHGVALMAALVRQAANVLAMDAKISISDIHHQHKKDAPSGTALALAAAAIEGRSGPQASDCGTGDDDIAFSSVREGEVVGEHTVRFEMPDEVIEITHKALERDVFARGALKAGRWLTEQAPGYYSTADWLGLR